MGVYVDNMNAPLGRMRMCHMVADTMDELLAMADLIGVNRKWFQPLSSPHFDICTSKKRLALANGAVIVDRKGLVAAIKRHRAFWKSDPNELEKLRAAAKFAKHPDFS